MTVEFAHSRGGFCSVVSSIFSPAADLTASLSASGTENLDVHFTDTNTHTYRHVGIHMQTTIVCEREEGCAKPTMWCVRTMLNGASLVSPYSEVTLSSQLAPPMN